MRADAQEAGGLCRQRWSASTPRCRSLSCPTVSGALALFRSAVAVTGTTPDKVTTDKHASYPPALDEVFCDDLEHRTSKYLNNYLEQDHRAVKGRYQPMQGFQTHTSAARFCRAHDEVRDFLRPATQRKEHVPAARRRAIHVQRVAALRDMLAVA